MICDEQFVVVSLLFVRQDEPLSPEFIASLDAVTAVLTYVLAALGVIVMTGMSERVKAIKDGIPEAQLPPAKGLAACVSNIGYFKYVLAEANKMESTMKISDSWTEAAAQVWRRSRDRDPSLAKRHV